MPAFKAAFFTAAVVLLVAAPSARTLGQVTGKSSDTPVREALSDMAGALVR